MGVILYKNPDLHDPVMLASWPGIGNIGVVAVNALRQAMEAEEFGEIEPWDFFYPRKVTISDGELADLEFPSSNMPPDLLQLQELLRYGLHRRHRKMLLHVGCHHSCGLYVHSSFEFFPSAFLNEKLRPCTEHR